MQFPVMMGHLTYYLVDCQEVLILDAILDIIWSNMAHQYTRKDGGDCLTPVSH